MSFFLKNTLVFGIFLALSGLANANSPKPVHSEFMTPQEQVTLTSTSVEKVVKVLPKLLALTNSYTGTHSVGADKKVTNSKYDAFTTALNELSGKHGFKDAKIMQQTVETTMLTAGFLRSGKTLKQVQQEITATQQRVEKNPKITAQQKSALLRRMHIQVSMVVPTSQNLKTVQPFYPRILAITDKK